jgi:hypothetical protein
MKRGPGLRCEACRKYSRRTFYCSKLLKVLDKDREACPSFVPRHVRRERSERLRPRMR